MGALAVRLLRGQLLGVAARTRHGPAGGVHQGRLLVNGQHRLGHGLGLKLGFVARACGAAQPLAQGGIGQQGLQRIGHGLRGVGHQPGAFLVREHFFDARQARGHNRHTRAHGLQNGNGQSLVVGQEHKNLVLRQALGHVAHVTF